MYDAEETPSPQSPQFSGVISQESRAPSGYPLSPWTPSRHRWDADRRCVRNSTESLQSIQSIQSLQTTTDETGCLDPSKTLLCAPDDHVPRRDDRPGSTPALLSCFTTPPLDAWPSETDNLQDLATPFSGDEDSRLDESSSSASVSSSEDSGDGSEDGEQSDELDDLNVSDEEEHTDEWEHSSKPGERAPSLRSFVDSTAKVKTEDQISDNRDGNLRSSPRITSSKSLDGSLPCTPRRAPSETLHHYQTILSVPGSKWTVEEEKCLRFLDEAGVPSHDFGDYLIGRSLAACRTKLSQLGKSTPLPKHEGTITAETHTISPLQRRSKRPQPLQNYNLTSKAAKQKLAQSGSASISKPTTAIEIIVIDDTPPSTPDRGYRPRGRPRHDRPRPQKKRLTPPNRPSPPAVSENLRNITDDIKKMKQKKSEAESILRSLKERAALTAEYHKLVNEISAFSEEWLCSQRSQ